MPQSQIFTEGPTDAPVIYEVPGVHPVVPIACQAEYDGSGAGGDFLPALIFRSQAGHVIARVPTSATVVAGDSAEVTWAPFLDGRTSGAPATATGEWCYAEGQIDADGTLPAYDHLSTLWPSIYSLNGSSNQIEIKAVNTYKVTAVAVLTSTTVTAANGIELQMAMAGSGDTDTKAVNGPWIVTSAPSGSGADRDWQPSQIMLLTVNTITNAGDPPKLTVNTLRRPAGTASGLALSVLIEHISVPFGGNL